MSDSHDDPSAVLGYSPINFTSWAPARYCQPTNHQSKTAARLVFPAQPAQSLARATIRIPRHLAAMTVIAKNWRGLSKQLDATV